jgi:hypothetical protein
MSRAADYTIKGFLYQFNKTILEILNSQDDSSINVEGIIEDVEIVTPVLTTAIQCKYHEASEKFTLSIIFKPLLQMMHHFHENPGLDIRYVLFAHFPSVTEDTKPTVGESELQDALNSKNPKFQKYIVALKGNIKINEFIPRFFMHFGPKFDDLVANVNAALKANGIPEDDIDTLAYPNSINMIAGMSVKHDPTERKITKQKFLGDLKSIRKTAISRWTMALRTRKQLLDARRKQLKTHLDTNSRLRYFVVDSKSIEDYSTEIVLFVKDYLDKYHSKPAHISTPVLSLCTSEDDFQDIQYRLSQKGIICADGYIANHFDESRFFRDPLSCKGSGGGIEREFLLRLLRWEDHGIILNNRKCDDLFIIGQSDYAALDTVDVNVEYLAATSLKEIKYVMGISNVYE